jgi:hypothetical protein
LCDVSQTGYSCTLYVDVDSAPPAAPGLADVVCGPGQLPAQPVVPEPGVPPPPGSTRGATAHPAQPVPAATAQIHPRQALPLPLHLPQSRTQVVGIASHTIHPRQALSLPLHLPQSGAQVVGIASHTIQPLRNIVHCIRAVPEKTKLSWDKQIFILNRKEVIHVYTN